MMAWSLSAEAGALWLCLRIPSSPQSYPPGPQPLSQEPVRAQPCMGSTSLTASPSMCNLQTMDVSCPCFPDNAATCNRIGRSCVTSSCLSTQRTRAPSPTFRLGRQVIRGQLSLSSEQRIGQDFMIRDCWPLHVKAHETPCTGSPCFHSPDERNSGEELSH